MIVHSNKWAMALLGFAGAASASIVHNDYWKTEHNWTNTQQKVEVREGISYGTDAFTEQLMKSGWTAVGHPDDWIESENV